MLRGATTNSCSLVIDSSEFSDYNNHMTNTNITDADIETLRRAAGAHGDYMQVAICDLAIHGEIDGDDYTCLTRHEDRCIRAMTAHEAVALCATAHTVGE